VHTRDLISVLDDTLLRLAAAADELRDLDAALGDGDLGITVRSGCEAVRGALAALDDAATPPVVLRAAAAAFANANPSTMAALVGGALLAAAKSITEVTEIGPQSALLVGRSAANSIATRGKAQLGDKTILDALVPSVDAMEAVGQDPAEMLRAGVEAARSGIESTRQQQSMRGRAAWLGERSIGRQDPGATAYLRFIEGLQQALATRETTG
jgi:dihydroxyacetone kinase-like protein